MDLELSPAHEAFRDGIRAFIAEHRQHALELLGRVLGDGEPGLDQFEDATVGRREADQAGATRR